MFSDLANKSQRSVLLASAQVLLNCNSGIKSMCELKAGLDFYLIIFAKLIGVYAALIIYIMHSDDKLHMIFHHSMRTVSEYPRNLGRRRQASLVTGIQY